MHPLKRRRFLEYAGAAGLFAGLPKPLCAQDSPARKSNLILCMADDMGWGDTGYNGHSVLKTPNLDRMAREGVRFNRFYSGAPVCSPTRGSCLTGRHPYRYGIFGANVGHLPSEEVTLAEVLKGEGYATGHFGKWHLGTLTQEIPEANRGGPKGADHYSPPWDNGFEVCFSTEAKVPTWDPLIDPNPPYPSFGTHYWTGPGAFATDNLEGDSSRIILDRAIPFIREAAAHQTPFLAVIWFHAPHNPVVAGPSYRAMYPDQDEDHQHYYGCITALDEQMGRLRAELDSLGIAEKTMLWFCSDNGPAEHRNGGPGFAPGNRQQGSAGPFRGRKASLYEGGVRVPGLLVWPQGVREPFETEVACSTLDYFPTVLDVLGHRSPATETRAQDGISLVPLLRGEATERNRPIGFQSNKQVALTEDRYKIYSPDEGRNYELYDLLEDPGEKNDLAQEQPQLLERMIATLEDWRADCKQSLAGEDD